MQQGKSMALPCNPPSPERAFARRAERPLLEWPAQRHLVPRLSFSPT